MPKTLLPFDHDKEAYSICVDLVWNKLRSNNNRLHDPLFLKLNTTPDPSLYVLILPPPSLSHDLG